MTVPPVNSIDRWKPRARMKNTAARNVTRLMMFSTSAWRMNGMVRWMRKNSMFRLASYRCDAGRVGRPAGSVFLGFPDGADGNPGELFLAAVPQVAQRPHPHHREIGRASCRERRCQNV